MEINLMNGENVNVIKFPDGQQDVVLHSHVRSGQEHTVTSRFNSFLDLELIICTVNALRNIGCQEINLHIPYLLGARSDRQFVDRGNSYLVEIVAPILNSMQLKSIWVYDVHSGIAAACIKRLKVIPNDAFIKYALADISSDNIVIMSPDFGAAQKIYSLCQRIGFKGKVLKCEKEREISTGKIIRTYVPPIPAEAKVLIVDDICDGGRTFVEIAKHIRESQGPDASLMLAVSHGIFSNGFDKLGKYFSGIYTTNSIRPKEQYNDSLVKVLDII